MFGVSHIAVIVDFDLEAHHGLMRAIDIAKQFNIKLTLVTCVYQQSVEFVHLIKELDAETIRRETCAFYLNKLNQLVDENQLSDDVTLKVLWHKSSHRGLLEYLNQSNIDLVIKCAKKHSVFKKLFTPTDWHLLRQCKAPILFVKQGDWPSWKNVLGAININADPAHQTLNHDIIDSTLFMAQIWGGNPHLLNAFPWPLVDIVQLEHLLSGEDHYNVVRNAHKEALLQYVKNKPFKKQWLHIAEGVTPEEAIPQILKSTKASLLVLGTVSRSGIEGITIGNTAENIIDELQCEVLAIK